ncbi:MAG: cation diffusion facilitator family transporter, partial [Bdellovibrionota bacterium]
MMDGTVTAPGRPLTASGEVRRVLYATLGLNILVAAAKIAYGYWADILSIRADGFHSVTDSLNNVIALVGVWMAGHPPDEEHPYGHAKFEIFAGGLIGLSLLFVAYDVSHEAFLRFRGTAAHLPEITGGAFAVLLGTLAVNLAVASYEERVGKRLNSPILLADATHTKSDCVVTSGVLLAVLLVRLGYPAADLIAAIGVSLFIAWAGIQVVRNNLKYLADTALVSPSQIYPLVLAVPGVASAHKLRTRGTPGAVYMDLHIQIAPHLNVVQAHQVTHSVINTIKKNVSGISDVTVHTEPARPHQRYTPL